MIKNIIRVLISNFAVTIVGIFNSFVFPVLMSIDEYAGYHEFILYVSYINIIFPVCFNASFKSLYQAWGRFTEQVCQTVKGFKKSGWNFIRMCALELKELLLSRRKIGGNYQKVWLGYASNLEGITAEDNVDGDITKKVFIEKVKKKEQSFGRYGINNRKYKDL